MTVETDLLRMLEPAVRPDGITGSMRPRPDSSKPIESRSFESILGQAQLQVPDGSEQTVEATSGPTQTQKISSGHGLDDLSRLDRIENSSLLNVLGQGQAKVAS